MSLVVKMRLGRLLWYRVKHILKQDVTFGSKELLVMCLHRKRYLLETNYKRDQILRLIFVR